ncbi:MAG: hypothetical protein QOI74_2360 [Micromonosporaceae bacterium]|nr:hypothetical protein [Micromonosporaceae bacterium]
MGIQFRLLGELGASIGDRAVDLGHARQRCVLAVLLIEANRSVAAGQLVDRVWADRPPRRPREALYGYISRLRHALAVAPDVRLSHRSAGYAITVDPMSVDLHRFRRLIVDARATDDDAAAVTLFDRALGLWRGPAFAALDTPWLRSVRDALDTERLAAELDRTDLALARGQHATVVGDLTTRAVTHPLDERLVAQLMLALYRCGRQADALDLYEQTRLRLADELGTDPGAALRQLHKMILTADPAITAPTGSGPTRRSSGSPVPRQVPPAVRYFTGREAELRTLTGLLEEAGRTVVISAVHGTAGIGKTALAVHWAHTVADRFPDGQLYVNLRGFDPSGSAVHPADAVKGFLEAFGVGPQRMPVSMQAQVGLYRSLLADKRVLVVLDNARDAAQVRPLLPGTAGCVVVVTSRSELASLAAEGAAPIVLDLLPTADARHVLARHLGASRVAAEPDAVDAIVASCARLPLALGIVAARAAYNRFSLASLAGELREARGGLDAFDGGDSATDMRAAFSWSYKQLDAPAARLFRLLGLHPGPDITVPAAASLAALTVPRARSSLVDLARAHLIIERHPGRYTFHDLLRAYATEQTHAHDAADERRAALHRMFDHYLHTACAADRLLDPHRDRIPLGAPRPGATPEHITHHELAMGWFTAEHQVLLGLIDRAATTGFDTCTWQLAWALQVYCYRRGHRYDREAIHRAALDAARRIGDRSRQAYSHRELAGAYSWLERYDDAWTQLRQALDLYGEFGDHNGRGRTHLALGHVLYAQGRHHEALGHSQQALQEFRVAGHAVGEGRALNAVGWGHAHVGDHEQAVRFCREAVLLQRETDDRTGESTAWDTLGYAYHQLGQYPRAVECFHTALGLLTELGSRYEAAGALSRLGDAYEAAADLPAARAAWQRSLDILTEVDHPAVDEVRAKLQPHGPPPDHPRAPR